LNPRSLKLAEPTPFDGWIQIQACISLMWLGCLGLKRDWVGHRGESGWFP